ncbi:DUF5677 domain-containing protein [Haloferax sp. Atlit-47N]|uniref:DUF5677 domain-containing protein n=2 Tax=unclassified Haloferax TaxID=2625095 RepID=UPI0011C06E1E|nr:DUF5677 domain-containing protein [Haloferax sp. Atlit-47N]
MSDDGILSDHRWSRRKLVPPMLDALGDDLALVKWKYEIVPELIWIAELLKKSGPQYTARIVEECAEASQEAVGGAGFVLLREYDELEQAEITQIRENIGDTTKSELSNHLSTLTSVYPNLPIAGLFDSSSEGEPDDEELQEVAETISRLSSKRSPFAMKVQGIWVGTLAMTGKLKIMEGVEFGDINEIFNYPKTEESKKVGAMVRAAVSAFHGVSRETESSSQSRWATALWERGFEVSECIFPFELEDEDSGEYDSVEESDSEFFETIAAMGFDFERELKQTLAELWYKAPHDPEFTGKTEVLDGLLMRQVNLACTVAISPQTWSMDICGMILRSMAETQITLEWFNKNGTTEDYKQFIDHGLGQRKLILEHQQRILERSKPDDADQLRQAFDEMEAQLEAEKYKFLIPVDVDSWSKKSTRDLAIEADCKDLYDFRFQYHNAAIHGSWDFIKDQNLVNCQNPLHQHHRILQFQPLAKNPFGVIEAGNLVKRSLDTWLQARGLEDEKFEIPDLPENVRAYLSESEDFKGMPGV